MSSNQKRTQKPLQKATVHEVQASEKRAEKLIELLENGSIEKSNIKRVQGVVESKDPTHPLYQRAQQALQKAKSAREQWESKFSDKRNDGTP